MKSTKLRKPRRSKLNLTIHPDIKQFATEIANKRRRSVAQLFEDLVEREWNRVNGIQPGYSMPMYTPLQELFQPMAGYYQSPIAGKTPR